MRSFYIVNTFDRPYERLIAEARKGMLFYVHPEMQAEWKDVPMSMDEATPLEDFGIEVTINEGVFHGDWNKRSTATYPNGRRRFWQGHPQFSFDLP